MQLIFLHTISEIFLLLGATYSNLLPTNQSIALPQITSNTRPPPLSPFHREALPPTAARRFTAPPRRCKSRGTFSPRTTYRGCPHTIPRTRLTPERMSLRKSVRVIGGFSVALLYFTIIGGICQHVLLKKLQKYLRCHGISILKLTRPPHTDFCRVGF